MSKIVLFQTIQFIISTQFSYISPIDRILSGAMTPGQSGHGNDGNKGVLRIPQSSGITGVSSSDLCGDEGCLFCSSSQLNHKQLVKNRKYLNCTDIYKEINHVTQNFKYYNSFISKCW